MSLRTCLKTLPNRRVRARGLEVLAEEESACRLVASTGRFFNQFLRLHHIVWLCAACAIVARAAESHNSGSEAPATVSRPVEETELTTLTLTEAAEQRLGIRTVEVARSKRPQFRLYGGEVVLPLTVAETEATGSIPGFMPLPPASPAEVLALSERQALADGEIQKALVQFQLAEIREERARTLVQSQSGSQRDLDDAYAAVQAARTALEIAQRHRALLGAPVEEMSRLGYLWVRVPVYVGDLPVLDKTTAAKVGGLGDAPGAATVTGRWVEGPSSSVPAAATVDWFYLVDNPDGSLRLGQRVGVSLPLLREGESLVIPWAAVIHDVQGGEWVYERTQPHTYVRRRVAVARIEGEEALLSQGPGPGAEVVTDGAAELFGTEFGVGH